MAQNSPPPQWQKGDLWDTDPNTFLAREAVKREDLSECYLTDDAIMKLLVNRREKTITGVNIFKFNETEFAKSGILRSRHKGRGAPALAPDGTVMTVLAGTQHNTVIQLNGGNRNLPVGSWSVENYQAKSDHPGYKAWLAGIKRTTVDAVRAGIPLMSINSTLTGPPRGWQQKSSEPEEQANDLRDKSRSPELIDPKLIDPRLIDPNLTNIANKGQHNLTNDFNKPSTNQAEERMTAAHPVTPQKTPPKDVPSEYATLPSNHSEITTSPGSSLSGADHSGTAGLERPDFDLVASNSAVSEPAPSALASSKSTTPEPAISKPTIPEAIISKLVSILTASPPASPQLTISEPVIPEVAASRPATSPTISKPGTPDPASSEPKNSGPTTPELQIPNLAASEPATSGSIVPESATPGLAVFQPVSPEPTATELIVSEPIASEPAVSESSTVEPASSEPVGFNSTNSEAASPQPIATEPADSQISASKPVAPEPTTSKPEALEPVASQLVLKPAGTEHASSDNIPGHAPLEPLSSLRIEVTKIPLEDSKPNTTRIPLPVSVQQRRASPSLGLMRFGSEPAVGLGIDTGFMEQTTPKQSTSMFRQQSLPRLSSFEIPESPPPTVHRSVLLGGGISRERTPIISLEATKFKHNNTTVSTGRLGAHHFPTTQPATTMSTGRLVTHYPPATQATSTVTQATPFQSPPPTPASNGSLKRKATEPLDRLVTFYVEDRNSDDMATFNFSERQLVENVPRFYDQFKDNERRVYKIKGPVYDVIEKPKIFEALLHWIDRRRVMRKSYSAPDDLECFYLDLYQAADNYELPGLSNAIINKMYDWHSTGTVQFQMIDRVYLMTEPGDGLRRFYFGCMMALSTEQFEDTPMEQAAVMVDLFAVAKSTWNGMEAKEAYHDA